MNLKKSTQNSTDTVESDIEIDTKIKKNKSERRVAQLQKLDPDVFEKKDYWDRKSMNGFTTLPRVLPIAMQIADILTKGKPIGHTYFCLWARQPDFSLVKIDNPQAFATEAGFSGSRALDTWKSRIAKLVEYRFIYSYPGYSGPYHHILLRDPVRVIKELYEEGKLDSSILTNLYGRFMERAEEVGASYD